MNSRDETRTLRSRDVAQAADLDRQATEPPGPSAALAARTVAVGTYPTATGVMYAVQMLTIAATEAEGATPSLTLVPGTFFALHRGATAPPVGSDVILELVDGLWLFRF